MTGTQEIVELSYSRLQTFKKCPWMYKLVYDEGYRSNPNGSMSLGMSLHRALANFLSPANADKSLEHLWQIYDEVWVNEGFAGVQATLDAYDAGRKMLDNFYETERDRFAQVIATEKDFSLPMDGVRFMGSIDCINKAADGVFEIVEFKTHADNWSSARVSSDLQMTLYEMGGGEGLGLSPLRLKYIFLSNGSHVYTSRTKEQKQIALDLIYEVAEQVRRKNFSPNATHCDRCEFAARCSKCDRKKSVEKVS